MASTPSIHDILLQRIESYCVAHDLTEAEFGRAAVHDNRWVARLRDGKAALAVMKRAEAFMETPPARVRRRADQASAAR